jgi:hypothetical protein
MAKKLTRKGAHHGRATSLAKSDPEWRPTDGVIRVPLVLTRNKAKIIPISRDRLQASYRHVD